MKKFHASENVVRKKSSQQSGKREYDGSLRFYAIILQSISLQKIHNFGILRKSNTKYQWLDDFFMYSEFNQFKKNQIEWLGEKWLVICLHINREYLPA